MFYVCGTQITYRNYSASVGNGTNIAMNVSKPYLKPCSKTVILLWFSISVACFDVISVACFDVIFDVCLIVKQSSVKVDEWPSDHSVICNFSYFSIWFRGHAEILVLIAHAPVHVLGYRLLFT